MSWFRVQQGRNTHHQLDLIYATGTHTLTQENDCDGGKTGAKFPEIQTYQVINTCPENLCEFFQAV